MTSVLAGRGGEELLFDEALERLGPYVPGVVRRQAAAPLGRRPVRQRSLDLGDEAVGLTGKAHVGRQIRQRRGGARRRPALPKPGSRRP